MNMRSSASRLATTMLTATIIASGVGLVSGQTASAVADGDWLGIVNTYRAMSGLAPVAANATWSSQAADHSCYMLQNGISHDETPGLAGYTTGGDTAGNNGNVAVTSSISGTPRGFIDLWMTGPFHAIGLLRHNLTSSGFGLCANPSTPTPWHSGGTLDVLRGLSSGIPRPAKPILFPGADSTTPLTKFVTEQPSPLTLCGWTGTAGLPLFALMPADVTSAGASLTGPNGAIETCVLHAGNTTSNATARSILDGDNAVVVMPRDILVDGSYTVSVNSTGGNVTWSFRVDQNAPLAVSYAPLPLSAPAGASSFFESVSPFRAVDTRIGKGALRLTAGQPTKIAIASADVSAISANFLAVGASANGFLTVYNCSTTVPVVSTLNFKAMQNIANQAIVPLKDGNLCLVSPTAVDVVIDINGYYRAGASGGFVPSAPVRLYDTRDLGNTGLTAGVERSLTVVGVTPGAPHDAKSVVLNVTVVAPAANGYLRVFPCGSTSGAQISSINFMAGDVRANTVVTAASAEGAICIQSTTAVHVVIDFNGHFSSGGGSSFVPLAPVRLFDSRSLNSELNPAANGIKIAASQVVTLDITGQRGVPTEGAAASLNITILSSVSNAFVTVFPCGTVSNTSSLNIKFGQGAVANGAMVKLSESGQVCIFASAALHLLVDINGLWS